jgi:hypothetical protein
LAFALRHIFLGGLLIERIVSRYAYFIGILTDAGKSASLNSQFEASSETELRRRTCLLEGASEGLGSDGRKYARKCHSARLDRRRLRADACGFCDGRDSSAATPSRRFVVASGRDALAAAATGRIAVAVSRGVFGSGISAVAPARPSAAETRPSAAQTGHVAAESRDAAS